MFDKKLLQKGYDRGVVQIIDSPMSDGTVCKIGEYWFYFGGQTAEEMSAEEYVKNIPPETIIDEIYDVLEEFSMDEAFKDEYNYYHAYLVESLDTSFDTLLWDILSKHYGHKVVIAKYGGNLDYPFDICLECEDCSEVLLDAGAYTICAREDCID